MTAENQIVGDGASTLFSFPVALYQSNFFPSRVARFWGKGGRADIQPRSVTLGNAPGSFGNVVITLWSAPNLGETLVVAAELE